MPTVYSGNYSTGTYTYTRVRVDYSGTSATATLLYTRTNNYTPATWDTELTFTFGGVSTVVQVSYSGPQSDAPVASVTFPISTSGGTYSGTAVGQNGTLFNFSGSVTISGQSVPPPAPTITFTGVTHNHAIVTYSVPNWGEPDSGRVRRWYGTDPNPTTNEKLPDASFAARRSITEVLTGLTPDTTYFVRAYSGNTALASGTSIASFTTQKVPVPPPLYPFYIPVLDKSKGCTKLYCSVEGKSRLVTKDYASVSGRSRKVLS